MSIPAFVNKAAPGSKHALEALSSSGAFDVQAVDPAEVHDRVRHEVEGGAARVVVAGGDGTIAAAAAAVAGTSTVLGVVAAGTLNHFAREHELAAADLDVSRLAETRNERTIDLGRVNDRIFLNTSSVGAYVIFVRTRERLERRFGYVLGSFLAGLRLLGRIRPFDVEIETNGVVQRLRTSLVFVGVGERELRIPLMGSRVPDGQRGLHVMIVRSGTAARLVALGLIGLARGIHAASRTPMLESFITDRLRIELRRPLGAVAVDGELVRMRAPLEYRCDRDALRVAVP
jgi:diacylglycerol kinase family enzyme